MRIKKAIAAYFALGCGFALAQSTVTVGGLITTVPGSLGNGLEGIQVTGTCEQSSPIDVMTDSNGVWIVEVIPGDTCVLHAMPNNDFWFETYWGQPGTWLYDTGPTGVKCPLQRAPGDFELLVRDDPFFDQSIFCWAVPEGEVPCENCQQGPYDSQTCELGDWDGNGIVSVVSDLNPIVEGVFLNDFSNVCLWSADMDGDGEITLVSDVMEHFVNRVFYGIEYPTCDQVGTEP